VKMRSHFG